MLPYISGCKPQRGLTALCEVKCTRAGRTDREQDLVVDEAEQMFLIYWLSEH